MKRKSSSATPEEGRMIKRFKSCQVEGKTKDDGKNDITTVTLPLDIWNIIINNLHNDEKEDGEEEEEEDKETQFIELAFVAQVSKQVNSICKEHKQQRDIQSIKVNSIKFQEYFATNGFLSCMIYVQSNETPCPNATKKGGKRHSNVCSYAALNGHLNCLKYAHENGFNWDEVTCEYAAMNGHLEVIKYAHENGCEWDEKTCSEAAKNGHLEVLKYAHENGCPWNTRTCFWAAMRGHLECLKYAHENGCPCNHDV